MWCQLITGFRTTMSSCNFHSAERHILKHGQATTNGISSSTAFPILFGMTLTLMREKSGSLAQISAPSMQCQQHQEERQLWACHRPPWLHCLRHGSYDLMPELFCFLCTRWTLSVFLKLPKRVPLQKALRWEGYDLRWGVSFTLDMIIEHVFSSCLLLSSFRAVKWHVTRQQERGWTVAGLQPNYNVA